MHNNDRGDRSAAAQSNGQIRLASKASIMVFLVFPNHMTTAMTSLQLASLLILPQVNNVAAYRINFILNQTQWVARLFMVSELGSQFCCL